MTKITVFCLIIAGCLFSGCDRAVPIEEGVSKRLAQERKLDVKDLHYKLFFNLPAVKDSAVCGKVAISFFNNGKKLPQVDFKAPEGAITSVMVSGEAIPWRYEREHIVFDGEKTGETVIEMEFVSPDQSLNRRDDLLYTLLVPDRARTLFPCFDQPDLKGRYSLELDVPEGWVAVSNTSVVVETVTGSGRKCISFHESEPLSTYLFSFVSGEFKKESASRDGRVISMYYRETDAQKLAQIPDIFAEVFGSLEWLEEYTGIKYPFEKYDFIALPGFQYGGMEHTGATLYNDGQIFLNEGAGIKEKMRRSFLISHETAHMWFGDYVTMEWFDEVWTKEVFANYFAAQMVSSFYPDVDLGMNFIDYAVSAYEEDRTAGSTPIKQALDNLRNAGLVYGNIIYNKSPIVMEMLAAKLGGEMFREGIRRYLSEYAYGNADWNDLIDIFDGMSAEDMRTWSEVWVDKKGMPTIDCTIVEGGSAAILSQGDQWGRGLLWQQPVTSRIIHTDGTSAIYKVELRGSNVEIRSVEGKSFAHIFPNSDAKGYGYFETGEPDVLSGILLDSVNVWGEVEKASVLINLNESYLHYMFSPEQYGCFLISYLKSELNPLLFSQAMRYLSRVNLYDGDSLTCGFDKELWQIAVGESGDYPQSCRRDAFSALIAAVRDKDIISLLYDSFLAPETFDSFKITESDLTSLAYELSIRLPEISSEILSLQRSRIVDADRLARFDFISRAVVSDEAALDSLFESLMEPENRRIEPWTASVLSYLNHPLRAERSLKYIRPALEELQEIQITGDIFFPKRWVSALLAGHPEEQADIIIVRFFADHPDYPPMLRAKIAQTRLPRNYVGEEICPGSPCSAHSVSHIVYDPHTDSTPAAPPILCGNGIMPWKHL